MEKRIAYIEKMELYFDTLLRAASLNPKLIQEESPLQEMLQELLSYYEGGQWLADYEADERAELPSGLKRGVLSQDGIYNLLSELSASDEN